MSHSIFDGLDDEATYTLPNKKKLRIVALDIYQRLEVQNEIKALPKNNSEAQGELFKFVVRLAVVDKNDKPYLSKADVNRLARIGDGYITLNIFNIAMRLSGVDQKSTEDAKKK